MIVTSFNIPKEVEVIVMVGIVVMTVGAVGMRSLTMGTKISRKPHNTTKSVRLMETNMKMTKEKLKNLNN